MDYVNGYFEDGTFDGIFTKYGFRSTGIPKIYGIA